MPPRALIIGAICLSGLICAGLAPHSARADSGETLDLAEVRAAASAQFDKLDKNADGTLDANEARSVMGKKEFKSADRDGDGTLTKDEYLALVEKLFRSADVDKDGTLSVDELRSASALALKPLLD
jgi:hypothetical protein